MNLDRIALANLRRRKARAAFVLAGLLIGVATTVALISLVEALEANIMAKLEKYGANILVTPKTESLPLAYEGLNLGGVAVETAQLKEDDLARIRTIKNARNIAAVGPLILGPVRVKGRQVLLTGVDFSQSRILKPWWKVQGRWPKGESLAAGAEAAKILGLSPGDRVEINGRRLTISGVLEPTGSQDDGLLLAPFGLAQEVLDKEGQVSLVEVAALCTECPIEEMVAQIRGALPGAKVMAIQQVVKGRMETIGHFRRIFYGVSALMVLVGGLMVLVTMMGSVRERQRDIGIFRAVGFRASQVVRIILLEAGVISLLAGLAGLGLGFGAARAALPFLTKMSHGVGVFDPVLAGASLFLALMVGLLAGLYPALMAARLDPNQALRAL